MANTTSTTKPQDPLIIEAIALAVIEYEGNARFTAVNIIGSLAEHGYIIVRHEALGLDPGVAPTGGEKP